MALADVLAAITWPSVTSGGISPIPAGHPLRTAIEDGIRTLYGGSPKAAQVLETAAAAGNLNFLQSSGGSAQGLLSTGKKFIALDTTEISNLYYFNETGRLVQEKFEITLIHEIIHTTGLSDPLPPGVGPTNGQMSAGFDFDGDTLRKQNEVARELGASYANNIQRNYYGTASQGTSLFDRFDRSISYSEGRTIDTPVIPENNGVGNDTLAPVTLVAGGVVKADAVHLIFGLGGDDNLNGGKGSDYLYGGEDEDTFIGSDGDDLFHGGGTRTSSGGTLALDDDGIDTADYSAAAASEFIKITTDVTVNTFHSTAIDASHRLLIQQTGAGKGTATIISIEKVKATAGVDTFEVTQLVGAQLAGSDGKGGLAEVDLQGQDKPDVEGDLIDATKMSEKLVIDLNPTAGFIQVEGNSDKKVKVLGAERAWGGEKDDEIKGNDLDNELKGGKGDDEIRGEKGGDKIYGGDGKDKLFGGDGEDEIHSGLDGDSDDGDADQLHGGGGKDKFFVNNGDKFVKDGGARPLDRDDSISLDSKVLKGGERDRASGELPDPDKAEITTGRYKDSDGTIYDYDKAAKTLAVTNSAGAKITIEDFRNEDGGIKLRNVDYSFKLTADQAQVDEGKSVTVRVELSGPNVGSGFAKDVWVHVSVSGAAQPIDDFDIAKLTRPPAAGGAGTVSETDGFFVLIAKGTTSGTAVIPIKPDTKVEGNEALNFTIDNYYAVSVSPTTGVTYSTPTDAATVIGASDKQEAITIRDSSALVSLHRSGGVEGFHKSISVAAGQYVDVEMQAFVVLDYLKIWDASTGRVYVDTGYVDGLVTSSFLFDDLESSGNLSVAIFTNDPGTEWNLALSSRNPPATSAAATGNLGDGLETAAVAPEAAAAQGLPSVSGFSAYVDGSLLHFTVSAPVAFEVKPGQNDPEGLGFRIVRDGDASAPLTLGWRIEATGLNPVSAEDFGASALPGGTIVFEEGESATRLLVQAFDDGLLESIETFRIVFFDVATGLTLATTDSGAAVVDAEIPLPLPGFGTAAPDYLTGTAQANNLYGLGGNDTLKGGAGEDYLNGGDGDDSLSGGTGSDILVGEGGSDVYSISFVGGNRDRINDFGSALDTDWLMLSEAQDVDLSFRSNGSDLVVTNLITLDEVRVTNQFYGGGVERIVYMFRGSEIVLSRNQIAERAGQFVYDLGNGQRTFQVDFEIDQSRLLFGPGITPDSISYARVGRYDLKITLADGGSVLVKNALVNGSDSEGFSGIVFSDGNVISTSALRAAAPMLGRDDPASGHADTILGTPGLDRIVGGLGDDLLVGWAASDLYEYSLGDGYDTISDTKGNPGDENVLRLHGVTPADVTLHRVDNSVELRINGQPAVLLDGQLSVELPGDNQAAVASAGVSRIEFDNGEVWDRAEILSMIALVLPVPPASATAGDDVLHGDYWQDEIEGLAGSDILSGHGGTDILDGGAGDDQLRGGAGQDYLLGDSGNDTILFARGDGADVVWDWGDDDDGLDILQFEAGIAPSEVSVRQGSDGRDFILEIQGTGDSVTLEYAIDDGSLDAVKFADGTIWTYAQMLEWSLVPTAQADELYGDEGDNVLAGAAGDDVLVGDDGDDSLSGDAGNDELQGGQGDDTYLFARGGGQDEVSDRYGGFDTIELAAGIAPTDVTVVLADSGKDLILKINGTTDQIRLDNSVSSDSFRIEQVKFADGTVWSHLQMWQSATVPTPGADTVFGGFDDNVLEGGAGADTLYGREGNDRLTGGLANDVLSGGAGDDTVVFNRGDGQDRIVDSDGSGGGFDTLEFGPDILPSQVTVERADSGRDVVLKIIGTTDQVILDNTNVSNLYGIEQVKFADGTIWTQAQILGKLTEPTAAADVFTGDYNDNELAGGAGNDTLIGNAGNDRLRGEAGNDLLKGGSGGDTYLFGSGEGQDVVSDLVDGGNSGVDTVEFDSTIAPSEVTVVLGDSGRDLVLKINGTTHQVTLDNTNDSADYRIEEVKFSDGTIWTHAQMLAMANVPTAANDLLQGDYEDNSLRGEAGDDTLLGKAGADRLQGDAGADLLQGGAGDDTYVFALGDGPDVIREAVGSAFAGGLDKIELGAGIDPGAVTVVQSDTGHDLIIKFNGTTDQITLDDSIDSQSHRIEQLVFADGTVWNHAALMALATAPTAGNDTFYGGYDDDKLAGGAGDDTLIGRAGNDIFYVGPGGGRDWIDGGTGTDRIFATAHSTYIGVLALSSVEVIDARGFDDVWVKMTDGADIYNFSGVTLVDIAGIDLGGGDDIITGSASDDLIVGGAGNDVMAGGGGFDVFSIGIGDGVDSLDGGGGYDIVLASADNVTLRFSSVQNVEAFSANGFVNVTIRTTDADESWDFYGANFFGINEINVGGGNDYLKANSLTHILHGGDGDDELFAQEGDDTLHGDAGDDYLSGWYGNDSYYGGLGDDYLSDEFDDDFYYYGLGDGSDIIDEYDGYDVLVLGAGITAADVEVTLVDQDVIFSFADGGQIVVYYGVDPEFAIDEVRFADGTVWTFADTLALTTTEGDDIYPGTPGDDTVDGKGGADVLHGIGGNDVLHGGSGADLLVGGAGDDTLEGGTGSDVLAGGEGNDSFRFEAGFGEDVIADAQESAGGGYDRIEFLGNILPGDVTVTIDGTDVLVSIGGTTDQIRLKDMVVDPAAMIEELAFADGTVSSLLNLLGPRYQFGTAADDLLVGTALMDILSGGDGDDIIRGGASPDQLEGGTGDDLLIGGADGDFYIFNAGDGHDVVRDEGGPGAWDRILIGGGLERWDTTVGRSDDGLSYILYFQGGENSITLWGAASGDPQYQIEVIDFHMGMLRGITLGSIALDVGNGDDVLTGTDSSDTLRGLGGNDIIDGSAGGDSLKGDAGDDMLIGGDGNDLLYGEAGGDVLDGGEGEDSLDGGLGADSMSGGSGDDTYFVDDPGDIVVEATDGGNDEVRTTAAAFALSAGIERLTGQSSDGQVLSGNALDNLIQGSWGDDVLDGGAGDDDLHGNSGVDVYRFARGDGDDTIEDWDAGNAIELAADILPEDVIVRVSDLDLVVVVNQDGGSITFRFGALIYGLVEVRFGNGTIWNYEELLARSMLGTEEADVLTGDGGDNVLLGLGGDDIVTGGWGNDTLEGGEGNDWLSGEYGDDLFDGGEGDDVAFGGYGADVVGGGAGHDVLSGDDGDDIMVGGEGDDELSGGHGDDVVDGGVGNDVLYGSYGADVFRFARGDGDDNIEDWDPGNAVEFAAGILPEDVELTLSGRDIVLTVNNDGGSIRFSTAYSGGAIDVRFEDGSVWTYDAILDRLLTGSEESDLLVGFYRINTLKGLGGDDVLIGNYLGDIFEGGTGNDVLTGGPGDDLYRFGPGFGDDMIQEAGSWGGYDRIEFTGSIVPAEVAVWIADGGRDLLLSIAGTTDRIRLDNAIVDGTLSVEEVLFADGTVWTAADLLARAVPAPAVDNEQFGTAAGDTLAGGASSDIIHGGAGDDAIDGGEGSDHLEGGLDSDVLSGGLGNDFYYYRSGDGHDVIRDWEGTGSGGRDTLQLGPGLQRQDVTVGRSADGLSYILFFGGGEGSITLYGAATGTGDYGIESIRFEDGDSIAPADLGLLAINVSNGDDILNVTGRYVTRGLGGNDIIDASAGWGLLKGDAGDDILIGGGRDDQLDGGAGSDVLTGGGGDDEYLVDELDTIVELAGGGVDAVLTRAAYYVLGEYLENLAGQSEGGQELIGNDVDNGLVGGFGDDVLRGGLGNDYLIGREGADLLIGGEGDDTYYLYAGDSSDSVIEADGEGLDQIFTQMAIYLLPDHVERLTGWSEEGQALTGNALDNFVYGAAGDDQLKGGLGNDVLDGGSGSDIYLFSRGDGDDYIIADSPWNPGSDVLQFGPDILPGQVSVAQSGFEIVITVDQGGGSVTLRCDFFFFTQVSQVIFGDGTIWSRDELIARSMIGTDSGEWRMGNPSDNLLMGLGGDDVLRASSGNDVLDGGDGNDILEGGSGTDQLTGGAGADRFQFYEGDTSTGSAADRITDFVAGEDRIAISSYTYGAFNFVGEAAFSGAAGEIRYWFDGTDTWIQVDAYGWGSASSEIVLSGHVAPTASDFLF